MTSETKIFCRFKVCSLTAGAPMCTLLLSTSPQPQQLMHRLPELKRHSDPDLQPDFQHVVGEDQQIRDLFGTEEASDIETVHRCRRH